MPEGVIGIFGGTGFYELLDAAEDVSIETPYGQTSAPVTLGMLEGRQVAFMPRHGKGHTIPPHKIPYKANLWAFKQLEVRQIISPTACGSLQPDIEPGHFVVTDQFIDRTKGREETFYDGPQVVHISAAGPYCPELRRIAKESADSVGVVCHPAGTCVVIEGPRFSTQAESEYYTIQGWHTINMTQYPEVVLARELQMCYVKLALVTDYDAGVVAAPGTKPATAADIVAVLEKNTQNVIRVIQSMLPLIPEMPECNCGNHLSDATL